MFAILSLRSLYSFVSTIMTELRVRGGAGRGGAAGGEGWGRPLALGPWRGRRGAAAGGLGPPQPNSPQAHQTELSTPRINPNPRQTQSHHAILSTPPNQPQPPHLPKLNPRQYLDKSVALVLAFIGAKMIAEFAGVEVATDVSLLVVGLVLGGGVAASLLLPDEEKVE